MLSAAFSILLVVVGAALLTAGAEAFAENVSAASARLGVSVLALGLLLAGAEPEEAITAMVASGQGHPALAAGDAVGANLVILTLTVGLAALVTRLPVSRRVIEYAVGAALAGVLAVALMWNGVLGRYEGLLLVLVYAGAVAWVWRRERRPPAIGELAEQDDELDDGRRTDAHDVPSRTGEAATGRAVFVVVLGLAAMVFGGYLAVRGAEGLVVAFGATDSVIGLTVLGLATSAEMVALVWAARRRGLSEIVLAGAVGSVAYNATVSLGLAALVSPLGLGMHNVILRVGVLTAFLPLVILLGWRGSLPRWLGVPLLAGYVAVLAWLFSG
ncbi:MAG: sodium:calcium antiporter [Nocardioidaceae bacterium]